MNDNELQCGDSARILEELEKLEDEEGGSCVFRSFEDEILKLILLFDPEFGDSEDTSKKISRHYLLEKLHRAYNKIPINLHPILNLKYLKTRRMINKNEN
jgi:hypothetical protein